MNRGVYFLLLVLGLTSIPIAHADNLKDELDQHYKTGSLPFGLLLFMAIKNLIPPVILWAALLAIGWFMEAYLFVISASLQRNCSWKALVLRSPKPRETKSRLRYLWGEISR